ncbi:unnamed protein product [Auanema sp. JU1783]|nr:unnamed protein product [Auanema sp. JU1783]
MFLLINLEDHLYEMGKIVTELVNNYNVPISIVDRVEKMCPRCSLNSTDSNESKSCGKHPLLTMPKEVEKDKKKSVLRPITKFEVIESNNNINNSNYNNDNHEGDNDIDNDRQIHVNSGQIDISRISSSDVLSAMTDPAFLKIDLEAVAQNTSTTVPSNVLLGEGSSSSTVSVSSEDREETPQPSSVEFPLNNMPNGTETDGEDCNINSLDKEVDTNFETLHPSLLACLLSTTPNVFAHYSRLSPSPLDQPSSPSTEPININFGTELNIKSPNSDKRNLGHVVSANGKLRRGRIVYNTRDLEILESFYNEDPNACADPFKKKQLMETLGIDALRVKVWFQNRRRKDKLKWLNEVRT